jgi:hypothetical protein
MSEELKEAYLTTIDDLEIAIRNCGLFEFKQINEYRNLIKEYESKIYDLSRIKKNNMTLQTFYYKENPISFKNGMVNATEIGRAFGKRPVEYLKTKEAMECKNFLYSINPHIEYEFTSVNNKVCRFVKGGKLKGTWVHEQLALDYARFLSLEFRDWLYLRLKEL